jgi:hypothetical protein
LILIVPGWAIWYVAKRDQREADHLNEEIRMMTGGLSILIATLLSSCGPSNEELRLREQARAKQQVVLRTRQEVLKHNAEERVRAGDKGPPKIYDDPGHRVATCYVPKPPDVAVSFETPFGKYVCGNSSAGKAVVEWRKWYCKGESDNCVLSEWRNGQPTFGPLQDKFDMGKLSADFGWKIGPYPLN